MKSTQRLYIFILIFIIAAKVDNVHANTYVQNRDMDKSYEQIYISSVRFPYEYISVITTEIVENIHLKNIM